MPEESPGWWERRLAAEGMWIDLVHLKAILMRPKHSKLVRRAKDRVRRAKKRVYLEEG
jgi:hypothetical protein